MVDTALFIGRFQPFHNGHLYVIQEILKKQKKIIIAIGSAEENNTPENPWTASERMVMIEAALNEKKIPAERYWIVPVRNINNYAVWVQHVTTLVPPFQHMYSGSPIVQSLFKKDGRFTCHTVKMVEKISGTRIREYIWKNNFTWRKMVPKNVGVIIEKLGI